MVRHGFLRKKQMERRAKPVVGHTVDVKPANIIVRVQAMLS